MSCCGSTIVMVTDVPELYSFFEPSLANVDEACLEMSSESLMSDIFSGCFSHIVP